ncbi:MAG: hypothetical protein KJ000_34155 [Pirellulaceae bacterium]|nr:hypothetical protein [Pirellulaceae bacterium]
MFSAKPFRELILALFGIAVAVGIVRAQPQRQDFWTVEARVGQADQVIVGTINKVSRKTLVAPGGADKIGTIWPNGQFEYTLTLKIGETLKGNLNGIVDDLRPAFGTWPDERYDQWMRAETSMLWLLGPTPERGQRRDWDFVPLGEPVPAERAWSDRRRGPHYSNDFRLLKDNEEVLACARAYAKTSPKVQPTHRIHIPPGFARKSGPWDYLIVPVEPTLEERAKRLIAAPQEFMPKGEDPDPDALRMLRFGGVDSLRYFKSDANAELLRSLLDEPSTANEAKPVCVRAYEILLHWGVETPLPKSAQEIRSLDLGDTDVTDKTLKQVAELSNLRKLDLRNTKVTDKGLKELARLTKLKELGLSESQLSDANLRVLRKLGLLHCLDQAEGRKRPVSEEEITALSLSRSPVTDAGLRELAALLKLTWLNLSDTQVTDAGLECLRGLPRLQRLYLGGTQVTDAGLEHLEGLTELQGLHLAKTSVTDAGLVHLRGLKKLEWLNVGDTQVTDAGIRELHKALPRLRITR